MLPTNRPPRILVTRADRLGDLVLSTPVFSALRKKFPQAWIAALTFLENREVLVGNPSVDEVLLYDKKGSEKGWWGNLRFARRLTAHRFDLVIHLHATNRMHWISWLACIPTRIGWDRRSPWLLTHRYPDFKREGKKHEAEYNFDLLEPLGVTCPRLPELHFPVSSRSRASLDELLHHHEVPGDRPWIVFHPAASCPSKIWSPFRFAELIRRLGEEKKFHGLLIGARSDRALVEKVKAASAPVPVTDLSGQLNLGMLAALLERSALLISNDSGPVHIAAALARPVISIFGRNQPGLSPARWRPLGPQSRFLWKDVGCTECLAHLCQIHFLCLDAISVEDVLREARPFLKSAENL